ncbi:MAG: DNA-formamidopyrimidine glycosylase [Verrucomicrobia bacterium]|nr:MAG: DNA-formamidopyrimidine glycosylase [Verrucomicrobiota bacterium]
MPELAEVEWYRKQWNPGLGDHIVDLSLHARNRVFRGTNTRALKENLIGEKLLRSRARGKQTLFNFSGDNWLGIHFGMTGKIRVESANFRPDKHDHLVLQQRERALVFTDARQFGRVRFHHAADEPDWWKSDVPEIISREFDQKFVDQFLDRHRKAPIKAVLLLQNGFSGIGNWMADEVLWRAKILPPRRAEKLRHRERAALLRAAKFVAKKSLETLGRDYSDLPRLWLIHQRWKRSGICPRHRTPLRRATIGGRTTAWCPRCQR